MAKHRPPLRKYYYVARKETYDELGDGRVRVTDAAGRSGVFLFDGTYLEGELTQASLHMLVWTGGPTIPKECNFRWPEVPVDIDRPSGWPAELEPFMQHQIGRK